MLLRKNSNGITTKANTKHIIQLWKDKGSTAKTFPPKVTNTNCNTNISSIINQKFIFLPILSSKFNLAVLALKPLKAMAIINVANTALLKYIS